MCGIFGYVSSATGVRQIEDLLRKAGQKLNHRGPDGEGIFIDDNCLLLHKRLAIIDCEHGHQPVFDELERYILIFNGEIYNYRELRSMLLAKGHVFKSASDSEVIVHLFEQFGPECVTQLRGMFSFAIWDKKQQTLFCARDRMGIKPFYYAQLNNGDFIFASEIKAIAASGLVNTELDLTALRQYLHYKFTVGERTFFKGIISLSPGCTLTNNSGNIKIQKYWDHQYSETRPDYSTALEEFRHIFHDAVRAHLISDVPVGAFLSGGLDSSSIVMIAAQQYQGHLQTFTCGTEGEINGDLYYADLVARTCQTKHSEVLQTSEEFGQFMKKCIWHLDEPGGGSTAIHGFYVSQRARQNVKVLLSGEGADEILGGYFHYWLSYFRTLPFHHRLLSAKTWWDINYVQGFKEILYPDQLDPVDMFISRHCNFSMAEQKKLLTGDVLKETKDFEVRDFIQPLLAGYENLPVSKQLMSLDLRTYLYRILHIYDRMCMAAKLENRVPFMDNEIVSFAMSLTPEVMFHLLKTKSLLRGFIEHELPQEVVQRPKTGFTLPVDSWFKGPLKPLVEDVLSSLKARDLFVSDEIERVWTSFLEGKRSREHIWQLISIEYWLQNFS